MELKRLSPLSSFFQNIEPTQSNSTKKENHQDSGKQEKHPSKEQVQEAIELLNNDLDFSQKGLCAELIFEAKKYGIVITNKSIEVRRVFGREVFTILANAFQLKENQPIVGRILDRKV